MPVYTVTRKPNGLQIHVQNTGGQEQGLLHALQECQDGRCSCPSAEYVKLQSMQVTVTPDTVDVDLQARSGTDLDPVAVQNCLDYIVTRLPKSSG